MRDFRQRSGAQRVPVERMERDPANYEPENAEIYFKSPGCEIDFSAP